MDSSPEKAATQLSHSVTSCCFSVEESRRSQRTVEALSSDRI